MKHGFLRGHSVPARLSWLIRDMTTQDPEGMAFATAQVKQAHGKAGGKERWLILEKMCRKHGISLEKRASTTAPIKNAEAEKWRRHVMSDAFLDSYEWRKLRMEALKRDGARCACCGATRAHGVAMHVDHIKPRKLFPNLALSLDNLQVLCEACNHGKGNWDMTDWRKGVAHV